MNPTVAALLPVFALIALGFLLKAAVFRADHFWEPVEKITYYVLFPALLVLSMAQARVSGPVIVPLAAVLAAVMIAIFAVLAVVARPLLRIEGPAFSAVAQGSVRFNTYVGLAAAASLHGRTGTALLAIVLALLIPLSNVLSVIALTRHGTEGAPSWRGTLRELLTNPLIIASAIGLAFSVTDTPLPPFVTPVLDSLGRASLALGLLAVGAGLRLGSLASGSAALAVSTVLKLIVSPVLAWLGCRALQLDALATAIAVLFAALPPAPSAYILTRRLGGDHGLMANVITVHTILAAITLPAMLSLLK
jgi:malonate transporter and related proteins